MCDFIYVYVLDCLNINCLETAAVNKKIRAYNGGCLSATCLNFCVFSLSERTYVGPMSQLKGVPAIG